MTIGDRVTTPAGDGAIIGWYEKGSRRRISVRLDTEDGTGRARIEVYDADEVAGAAS